MLFSGRHGDSAQTVRSPDAWSQKSGGSYTFANVLPHISSVLSFQKTTHCVITGSESPAHVTAEPIAPWASTVCSILGEEYRQNTPLHDSVPTLSDRVQLVTTGDESS